MLIKLRPEHADALKALFSVIRSDPSAQSFHPHGFTNEDAARIADYSGRDIYAGYFSERDDICAYGMLRGMDEGYEIPSLGIYVAPGARGTGIARLVMDGLHTFARRDLKAPKIMLKVYSDNLPALNLYQRIGYEFKRSTGREFIGYFSLTPRVK